MIQWLAPRKARERARAHKDPFFSSLWNAGTAGSMDTDLLGAPRGQDRGYYGQNWGYQSRSGGQARWESRGWSNQQYGGGWSDPWPSSGVTLLAHISLTRQPRTALLQAVDRCPSPVVLLSHASSRRSVLRSTVSLTPVAPTLTALWSLSHGRTFHFFLDFQVCLPEGVAEWIFAERRLNSVALAPLVTICNESKFCSPHVLKTLL